MKKKEITWIEDNRIQVTCAETPIIVKLWEKEIRSNICILNPNNRYGKSKVKELNDIVLDGFTWFLIDKGKEKDEDAEVLYPLINKTEKLTYIKGPFSDIAKKKEVKLKKIKTAIKTLPDPRKDKETFGEKVCDIQEMVDGLVKDLALDKEKDIVVLNLLTCEQKALTNPYLNEPEFLLSMFLYRYFVQKGFDIFMRCTCLAGHYAIQSWKTWYKFIDTSENNDVHFYYRDGDCFDGGKNLVDEITDKVTE